jgi:hypothetical protein
MQDQEQWKDIAGYKGLYRVSTLGNVWSCRNHKQLQTSITTNGYRQVSFCVARRFKSYLVHRLVAQVWLPEPEGLTGRAVVDHINFDRTDNLRWVSYDDNNRHTIANQRHYTKRGS